MTKILTWTVEDAGPYELVRVRRECAVGYAVRTQSFSNANNFLSEQGLGGACELARAERARCAR